MTKVCIYGISQATHTLNRGNSIPLLFQIENYQSDYPLSYAFLPHAFKSIYNAFTCRNLETASSQSPHVGAHS